MSVFILGQGDVSPDLLFVLHCQLSPLHLLLSCWLIILFLCWDGRIYILLKGTHTKIMLFNLLIWTPFSPTMS